MANFVKLMQVRDGLDDRPIWINMDFVMSVINAPGRTVLLLADSAELYVEEPGQIIMKKAGESKREAKHAPAHRG